MHVFETVLMLLLGATVLSTFARKLSIPYPTLIAVGGAMLAFVPGVPRLELAPDLILALFVAPILLDAAHDTSLRDLRRSWVPVSSLVLVAVVATTLAVAFVAHALVPQIPWAAAIALGALLAPPDAVAALAVLKHVDPPHRIRVVLEGESLLNDASALLIYRLAVSAVAVGGFKASEALPMFALVVVGSVVSGWLLAKPVSFVTDRISDAPSSVIFQFVATFGVWITAERLGLSGVVTIVVFGITLARRTLAPMPAHLRVPSFAIWDTTIAVLNVMAFTLIGLQLRPILETLTAAERVRYLEAALIIFLVVIVVRLVWVLLHQGAVTLKNGVIRGMNVPRDVATPTMRDALVVGWSGMRGIVTLAAAMALPVDFPYRDFIQLTAFVVVLGTLIVQGLSLRPLLLLLGLPKDRILETELKLARETALEAGIASLKGDETPAALSLKKDYVEALRVTVRGGDPRDTQKNILRQGLIVAARAAIEDLRSSDAIGDKAYRRVEEELDQLELSGKSAETD